MGSAYRFLILPDTSYSKFPFSDVNCNHYYYYYYYFCLGKCPDQVNIADRLDEKALARNQ